MEFEAKNQMSLPEWYKTYIIVNEHLKTMNDLPIEFIYNALKERPKLLNIINSNYLFCMADPEFFMRKL